MTTREGGGKETGGRKKEGKGPGKAAAVRFDFKLMLTMRTEISSARREGGREREGGGERESERSEVQ